MKYLKSLFCILFVLLLALSGCSNLYSTTIVESRPPKNKDKVTLKVLAGLSTTDAGIEEMLTDMLKVKFPKVNLEWESVDWGEQFASQLQAKFASGEIPDLMIGKAQDVATYASSGYLAPIDSSVINYMRPEGIPGVTTNNHIYGVSYNATYQGVLYNKNYFWRYDLQPPKTLKDLDKIDKRFKEVGITPFATHFQENWYVGNIVMQFAMNQIFLHDPVWGDQLREGKQSFAASKEFQTCLQQVKDLLNNTWSNALTINQAQSDKRFAQGDAAMYLTGSWSLQAIQSLHPDMQIGIFPYPNTAGDAKLLFEPNLTFMKSSKSTNSDLIDQILLAIFKDNDLAESIYDFTQTSSMIKAVEPLHPNLIRPDTTAYANSGKVADVTTGNTQLIWTFQDSYSRQLYQWLEGKTDFNSVLKYMDDNKENSIQQK